MSIVQQELTELLRSAAARVTTAFPTLSAADTEAAYAVYRDHFAQGGEEPPVSDRPATDELLLALWDTLVDWESDHSELSSAQLDTLYQEAFGELLAPTSAPIAEARPLDVDCATPAAVVPAAAPPGDFTAVKPAVPDDSGDEAGSGDPIYVVKITLDGSQPLIWRRVLIPASVDLSRLHHIVQSAMGWSDSHMHQFYPPKSRPLERLGHARLGDLLRDEGDHCGYEYDFGDSWYHDLTLEGKQAAEPGRRYPVCTGGQRACPPEDIGGIPGYLAMLAVLDDPGHEDYEEMAGWLTQDFNPAAFSIEQANLRLGRYGTAAFPPAD